MPSADSISGDWLATHHKTLSDFSTRIESCIANSEWEGLAAILESRQQYFEQLLGNPIPDCFLAGVKQIAASVVKEDAGFVARVQDQKNIAAHLQASLERGRQAVRAYNNNL